MFERSAALLVCSALLGVVGSAQQPTEKALPEIETLMREVIAQQRATEAAQQNYLVHEELSVVDGLHRCDPYPDRVPFEKVCPCMTTSWVPTAEVDQESEVFSLQGIRVSRLLRVKNWKGRGGEYTHALSVDELRQENTRIGEEVAQVLQARAKGDGAGEEQIAGVLNEIRISRFLELGTYANPRRDDRQGRDVIVVDYTGMACKERCTPIDGAAEWITGTLKIDETDRVPVEFHGTFRREWKVPGGGAIAPKDAKLTFWSTKLDDGLWFPVIMEVSGNVGRRGRFTLTKSAYLAFKDYRRFKVTSTILPDFALVPDEAAPKAGPTQPQVPR